MCRCLITIHIVVTTTGVEMYVFLMVRSARHDRSFSTGLGI